MQSPGNLMRAWLVEDPVTAQASGGRSEGESKEDPRLDMMRQAREHDARVSLSTANVRTSPRPHPTPAIP